MPHCCEEMEKHLEEREVALIYTPRLREYGIRILDGGSAVQRIGYCPWCGNKLPPTLRREWFDMLEENRIEPSDPVLLGFEDKDSLVTQDMLTDRWWKKRGL